MFNEVCLPINARSRGCPLAERGARRSEDTPRPWVTVRTATSAGTPPAAAAPVPPTAGEALGEDLGWAHVGLDPQSSTSVPAGVWLLLGVISPSKLLPAEG